MVIGSRAKADSRKNSEGEDGERAGIGKPRDREAVGGEKRARKTRQAEEVRGSWRYQTP